MSIHQALLKVNELIPENITDIFKKGEKNPEQMHGYERYIFRFRFHIFNFDELKKMCRAYLLGKELHRGEYRGDGVTYYFKHLRDVDELITCELAIRDDWELNVAIWLHDTVEADKITLDQIQELFGFNVRLFVDLLSKGEDYKKDKTSYVRRLYESKNIRAIILKLADRVANLRTLGFKSNEDEFQIRQINETIREYLFLADYLVELMQISDYWKNPKHLYIGIHLRDALRLQIRSFQIEYGDRIIVIT